MSNSRHASLRGTKAFARAVRLIALGAGLVSSEAALAGWTAPSRASDLIAQELTVTVALPQSDNPLGCSIGTWYRLPTSASNYQAISAALMSAIAQGKEIQVWPSSCDSDGTGLIVAVWVKQ